MTPQERELIDALFDRLAPLEQAPRDPDALAAIEDGLRRAPHAVYALVQTALVQDEALRRAAQRIEELEGRRPAASGSFLDAARSALGRGSVPAAGSAWSSQRQDAGLAPPQGNGFGQPQGSGFGQPTQQPQAQPSRGGSFLGTAASAAAGVIGGALLMDGIRSMLGGHGERGAGLHDSESRNPWGGGDDKSPLAREAGLNDVGRNNDSRQGFADTRDDQRAASYDSDDDADGDGGDFGGFDSDSDYA